MNISKTIITKAQAIKLLICDVDGVLTTGAISYDESGKEIKTFHVHDGLGLKLLKTHGIEVAIITSRQSPIVTKRMQELGVSHVMQGQKIKIESFQQLLVDLNLGANEVAYIGDDLPDVPVMKQVGLSIAVANARPYVQVIADMVTQQQGGHGAVREVCDILLTAQHKLAAIHEQY